MAPAMDDELTPMFIILDIGPCHSFDNSINAFGVVYAGMIVGGMKYLDLVFVTRRLDIFRFHLSTLITCQIMRSLID